jgi:methylated-DNA-protein-cysteine methyltransferase related protein
MTKVQNISKSSDFFQNVFEIVKLIPRGRATSYGAIAKYLGSTSGARLVGYAMNACHTIEEKIPAHRVVNRNGLLTGKGHFGRNNEMADLLKAEGIEVINDQIQDWKKVLWDPSIELM